MSQNFVQDVVILLFTILNATSAILACVTAYLYFWVPNIQNAHGTCVFHLSLNIGSLHAMLFAYAYTQRSPISESFCIIEALIIVFIVYAASTWSILLSYNTWKYVKISQSPDAITANFNTRRRLMFYRILGYSSASAAVLWKSLVLLYQIIYTPSFYGGVYLYCIRVIYILGIPIVVSSALGVFYFMDSQRRLWNSHQAIMTTENKPTSFIKKLKYRIRMNIRLGLLMNVPLILCMILQMILVKFDSISEKVLIAVAMVQTVLLSLEGTFIFLVTVAFRKRVIKGFLKHGRSSFLSCIISRLPERFVGLSEDEEETENESEEHLEGSVPLQSITVEIKT